MKMCIVVFSQTGNTYSVAKKLKDKLFETGYLVDLEWLKIDGNYRPGLKDVKFKTLPELEQYDSLIFGSFVEAFSLSATMRSYLKQLDSLENKKVACFVTQAFPYPWLGGNHAIRQMKKICESKGTAVIGSGIVNWSNKSRERKIVEVVDKLSQLF